MADEDGLQELRSSLEADGYRLEVERGSSRVDVRITATADACPDCLVPEPLMLSVLGQALGVSEESIDLSYPDEREHGSAQA